MTDSYSLAACRLALLAEAPIRAPYALALAMLVAVGALILLKHRPTRRFLRIVWIAIAAWTVALVSLGTVRYRLLHRLCEENNLMEWLGADFLLLAWIILLILTIRMGRRQKPSPLAALLMGAMFAAFWRELEFGKPFFGNKVIYSRNFFRPRAYTDTTRYFEEFTRSMNHAQQRPLAAMHWVGVVLVVIFLAVLGGYLWRHRKALGRELHNFAKCLSGKLFFVGVGLYLLGLVGGKLFDILLENGFLAEFRRSEGLTHRVFDEPLETYGALFLLLAAIELWHYWPGRADDDEPAEDVGRRDESPL